MANIFHITKRGEWERAQREGIYRIPTLDSEGFIHCSRSDQVVRVANNLFRGQTGLVLLEIDTGRVGAEIRYENCEGGQEDFPHIYGAIELDAVVRVSEFEPGEDGSFALKSGAGASAETAKPRVFISHTDRVPADKMFTNLVVQRFKEEGVPYWIDREHPFDLTSKPGADGPSTENPLFFHLCEAIADSDVLLFIISAASVQREFCRLEFDPRVLFGPGAQAMAGKSALMVKLDDIQFNEVEVVLSALCGEGGTVDMTSEDFEGFWQAFKAVYEKATVGQKDETWRQHPSFQPQKAADPLSEDERAALQVEGHDLHATALARMAEDRLEEANELLADAYQALHAAGDARGIADVLYSTFVVSLRMGLEDFGKEHEVVAIGSIVIKDTKQMALNEIRYAMQCLRGCIDELSALGDEKLSLEMEKRFEATVRMLEEEHGIVRVPGQSVEEDR